MKNVVIAIVLSLAVISACIVYLLRTGISLRTAPLIQPSIMTDDKSNVASSLVLRLFQEFQNGHYIVWGVLPANEESNRVIEQAARQYEKKFHSKVHFIRDAEKENQEYIRACTKPCWLLVSQEKANQLQTNSFIENNLLALSKPYLSITIIPFHKNQPVSEECNNQKRLSLNCLISVSIRGVQRKMKDTQKHYFFLQKYNEKDFFLFIEQNT